MHPNLCLYDCCLFLVALLCADLSPWFILIGRDRAHTPFPSSLPSIDVPVICFVAPLHIPYAPSKFRRHGLLISPFINLFLFRFRFSARSPRDLK